MDPQDAFVERAVAFQKLVTPKQLEQAKAHAAGSPGTSLLQALAELGLLRDADARNIQQLYERNLAKQGAAAPRPAAPAAAAAPTAAAAPAAPTVSAAPPPPLVPAEDAGRIAGFRHLDDFLGYAREIHASDLHINVAYPPVLRKYGRLVRLPRAALSAADTEALLFAILSAEQRERLEREKALDFCYAVPGQGRYRSCILKERVGWDASFRVIESRLPTFEELGLPAQLKRLTEYYQGLVLVTGPMGCGKSTTMAAMVELINQSRDDHVITIEDPIEFEFVPARSQVNQREVGTHTESFAAALRAALREDPDVIVIGELRDLETISLAIRAAETGHLVFGTLHTTSAARTIDRILDVFPPDEQPQVRSMISESIRGIICQQLVPRRDGTGRALALEIMLNTPAVANMIRERKLFQMPSVLQTSKKQGMQLLDNALLELVNQGVVDGLDAYDAADNKGPFAKWAPRGEGAAAEG
jgi:twitching motility protein PilT